MGFAFIVLIIGAFHALAPQTAWYLSIGWKLREAEPSEFYLNTCRIGGVIACIISLIVLVSSCVSSSTEGNAETKMRESLNGHMIASMTSFQLDTGSNMVGMETPEERAVKQYLLEADWSMPGVDYNAQGSFGSMGELELRLDDGNEMTVYDMGSGLFGIGRDWKFPEYVFNSSSLKQWFDSHAKTE